MLEIKDRFTIEYEVKRSRFIAILIPVLKSDEIVNIIEELKITYPKANHYCYGFLIGANANNGGYDDDGEPSRTAGLPIFNMLKHYELTNTLCVVVRYFGGIKLGAGGLIRAYQNAAKLALENAPLFRRIDAEIYRIEFSYEHLGLVDKTLMNVNIKEKEFGKNICYDVITEKKEELDLLTQLEYLLISLNFVEKTNVYIPLLKEGK